MITANHGKTTIRITLQLILTVIGLIVILAILAISLSIEASGKTITVREDGTGDYSSIGSAVENATRGDVIEVGKGNYSISSTITVNQSMEIRGIDGPETTFLFPEYEEINGTHYIRNGAKSPLPIFRVNASNVTIKGFTFSILPADIELNETELKSYMPRLYNPGPPSSSPHVFIYGPYYYTSHLDGLTVENNRFIPYRDFNHSSATGELYDFTAVCSGGIMYHASIRNNTAQNLSFPFLLSDIENSIVENNTITASSTGIITSFIRDVLFRNNIISESLTGIYAANYNFHLRIEGNAFIENRWDIRTERALMGTTVIGNTFSSTSPSRLIGNVGFSASNSRNFTLEGNTFINRGQVILDHVRYAACSNNTFNFTELNLNIVSNLTAEGNTINGRALRILSGIKGEGQTINVSDAGEVIVLGSSNLKVNGMKIEGIQPENQNQGYGIRIIDSNNIGVANSSLVGFGGTGVFILNSSQCIISDSLFDSGYSGIYLRGSYGCFIVNSRLSNLTSGVVLRDSNISSVRGCEFSDGGTGVELNNAYLCAVFECNFTGMVEGIESVNSNDCFLSINKFEEGKGTGIRIFDGMRQHVLGNIISGGQTGIEFLTSLRGEVKNNTITGFSGFGIALNYSSNRINISDNLLKGDGRGSYGLFILFSDECTVTGNSITLCEYGVKLENASKNNLTENDIQRNSIGVYIVHRGFGLHFENNTISNNTLGADAENTWGPVDLTWNYWGAPSGPFNANNNSEGKGDRVSDNIMFIPFQSYPGEKKPTAQPVENEEETFVAGLTERGVAALVADLIILSGVGGLWAYWYWKNRVKI